MSFQKEKMNHQLGLKIGADDAPIKVIEYINLRCPDSRDYELHAVPYLEPYIQAGQVQRIIKHFDKEVRELEKGNLMHQYLNYETPAETVQMIQQLFQEQATWASQRLSQIPHLAQSYGLELQAHNQQLALDYMAEIEAVQIKRIPTVFVGEEAFVETIEPAAFKKALEMLM